MGREGGGEECDPVDEREAIIIRQNVSSKVMFIRLSEALQSASYCSSKQHNAVQYNWYTYDALTTVPWLWEYVSGNNTRCSLWNFSSAIPYQR